MKIFKKLLICMIVIPALGIAKSHQTLEIPFQNVQVNYEKPMFANYNFDSKHQLIVCSTDFPMPSWSYGYVVWIQGNFKHTVEFKKDHPAVLQNLGPKGQLLIGYAADGRNSKRDMINVSCIYSNK